MILKAGLKAPAGPVECIANTEADSWHWLPRHGKPLQEESRTLLKCLLTSLRFTGACRECHYVMPSHDFTGLSAESTLFSFDTLDGANIGQMGAGTISLYFFQNKDIN